MGLIWLDVETTGLNPGRHEILELGMVATDDRFERVADDLHLIIEPVNGLDLMALDHEVVAMHAANGLFLDVVREGLTLSPEPVMNWLGEIHERDPLTSFLMAGSSVHFDRAFLREHLPGALAYFSHRVLDVSTVKELVRRLYGEPALFLTRSKSHRVILDIEASIAELRYYLDRYFRGPAL